MNMICSKLTELLAVANLDGRRLELGKSSVILEWIFVKKAVR
jgi:hypothetical protein